MLKPNLPLKGKIVERFGSQAKFAEEMHLSPSIVSSVTNGRWVLEEDERKAWAAILGYTVEELFQAV